MHRPPASLRSLSNLVESVSVIREPHSQSRSGSLVTWREQIDDWWYEIYDTHTPWSWLWSLLNSSEPGMGFREFKILTLDKFVQVLYEVVTRSDNISRPFTWSKYDSTDVVSSSGVIEILFRVQHAGNITYTYSITNEQYGRYWQLNIL